MGVKEDLQSISTFLWRYKFTIGAVAGVTFLVVNPNTEAKQAREREITDLHQEKLARMKEVCNRT